MVLMTLDKSFYEQAVIDIANGENLSDYKHHPHPDIRSLVAGSEHAVIAYIVDPAPEVRMTLIKNDRWLRRIAPTEKHPKLILALIAKGIIHPNFRKLNLTVVNDALNKLEKDKGI